MTPQYIVTLVLLIVLLAAIAYAVRLLRRPKEDSPDQSVMLLAQRLESLSQQVAQGLEQTRQSSERATAGVFSQVQSFTKGMTELQEAVKGVQDRVRDVATFQDIFRSPKLRGIWGEASLESALAQYFPRDRYEIQHYFKSGEAVDAALKLPNDLLLCIDSKFNWENFEKMLHADNEVNRDIARRQFLSDVKKKIDEIASKYILPGEGTTDFALMYMPAETLYYEVIQNIKDADLSSYARAKKVILVSPNTFFLTVSAVMHWFRDVNLSKQTQDIAKRLSRVVQDAGKLADDFRVLGKHLGNAQSAFDDTDKRLGLLVERTQRVIEMSEDAKSVEVSSRLE
jgi:DNA recombination protein RmuC